MARYRTQLADTKDGTATFADCYLQRADGSWQTIGRSNAYREYPRMVRARSAGEALCRAHQRKHYPLTTFTAERAD